MKGSVTFRAFVGRRKPSHVTGVPPTSVDEQHRRCEREQQEQSEEEEAPGLNIGERGSPQDPKERQIEEHAVTSCHGRESGTCGPFVEKHRDFFLGDQSFVDAALDANLGIGSVSVDEELPWIRASAVTTGWHGVSSCCPTARDSSTIRLNFKKGLQQHLSVW